MDPSDPLAVAKAKLRRALADRVGPSEVSRPAATAALHRLIVQAPWWRDAAAIAAFVGVKHEPRTTALIEDALASGKRVLLPRVDGSQLLWGAISALDELVAGRFGLLELPRSRCDTTLAGIDLVLVPGLAFGPSGERLGWGRGYYDGALASLSPPLGLRVGVCWADRFGAATASYGPIPMGPRDIPMHRVVTENGDVECAGEITRFEGQ